MKEKWFSFGNWQHSATSYDFVFRQGKKRSVLKKSVIVFLFLPYLVYLNFRKIIVIRYWHVHIVKLLEGIIGTKYLRMNQVKFLKGCLPQVLYNSFLNTLSERCNKFRRRKNQNGKLQAVIGWVWLRHAEGLFVFQCIFLKCVVSYFIRKGIIRNMKKWGVSASLLYRRRKILR